MMKPPWVRRLYSPLRCDICGQFVSFKDLEGEGRRVLIEPDNHFGPEVWETLCAVCASEER